MNKNLLTIVTLLLFGAALVAQDKAEVNVKITKDGKLVKDTVYTYDDLGKAKQVIHMMEMMTSDEMHFEADKVHMKMSASDEGAHKKMIFISEDGDVKDIHDHDMHMSWTTEDGDSVKVIKISSNGKGKAHAWVSDDMKDAEHVVIHENDGKVDIVIKKMKEGDGKEEDVKKIKKEIIVVTDKDDGDKATWTVKAGDSGELIMVNENGKTMELIKDTESLDEEGSKTVKWISEDGEHVKITVIKTGSEEDDEVEMEITIEESKDKQKKKKK
ncbi:hypothetical protein ACFLT1_05175 [Bacteroidota bacterium]